MNHISQKNRLEQRLKLYKDFVPYCPNDSLSKLLNEMLKISLRIEKIREMNFDKLLQDVHFQYETKQSKANYLRNYE